MGHIPSVQNAVLDLLVIAFWPSSPQIEKDSLKCTPSELRKEYNSGLLLTQIFKGTNYTISALA